MKMTNLEAYKAKRAVRTAVTAAPRDSLNMSLRHLSETFSDAWRSQDPLSRVSPLELVASPQNPTIYSQSRPYSQSYPPRRLAYTDITYKMLEYVIRRPFTAADWMLTHNLPSDARIWRVQDEPRDYYSNPTSMVPTGPREVIRVFWESKEFAEVPEGSVIPSFNLVFSIKQVSREAFAKLWEKGPTE